jgi:RNA polymerase sigma-70 factor (ECF subfamily)
VVVLDPLQEGNPLNDDDTPTWRAPTEDPERQSARREMAHLLQDAIDELPATFRPVYILREIEGLSVQETAESLGIEPNTVKTRLHRARGLLRQRLMRDFDGATGSAFPFGAQRCDRLVAAVLAQLHQETQ